MDKFRITGGRPLSGRVTISGAKNSALPCMAAAILTPETVTLHNVPYVRDCLTQRRLLEDLGATVLVPDLRTHKITAANVELFEAPYDLVKTMRASVLALGPLIARFGKAKVSLPGGCAIGTRPIDMHLEALKLLGAQVHLEAGDVVARAPKGGRLVGADVTFPKVTVTGTENLLMAAALARGTTRLRGAAREPEIADLADLLNRMGARVRGAGSETITVEGVESLGGAEHTIIPDRIETGTFIAAAAITDGELEIKDCCPEHLESVIAKLREAGVEIEEVNPTTLYVRRAPEGLAASDVVTDPYPGFPTDMQAQYMALMTQARGRSRAGFGPARLGLPRPGGPGRARRDLDRPRLPHRPRLREDRGQAARRRRRDRARARVGHRANAARRDRHGMTREADIGAGRPAAAPVTREELTRRLLALVL